jgi:hypothetical protein
VNCLKRPTLLTAFVALTASAAAARAGELGPTSRDSVSISITIAPHVAVSRAPQGTDIASPDDAGFCVETNGMHDYHVAVLGAAGPARQQAAISRSLPAGGRMSCGGAGSVSFAGIDPSDGDPRTSDHSSQAVTLLITPD